MRVMLKKILNDEAISWVNENMNYFYTYTHKAKFKTHESTQDFPFGDNREYVEAVTFDTIIARQDMEHIIIDTNFFRYDMWFDYAQQKIDKRKEKIQKVLYDKAK